MFEEMSFRDYFLLALKAGMGRQRIWINSLISYVFNPTETKDYPFKLHREVGDHPDHPERLYFYPPGSDGTDQIYIDDLTVTSENRDQPYIHLRDEFVLQPGELDNYKGTEPLVTCYGNVFFNQLCLVEPFGDLFPFVKGLVVPTMFEDTILEKMIDDRADGDETVMAPDGKLYVWQYLKFCDHCCALPGYSSGLVTSNSRKSLQSNPAWPAARDAWIKQNQHRIHDPAAVAELSLLADKMDDEYLAGDQSQVFYKAKKKLAGARRKVHYMFGGESPFSDGTSVELISKSLVEGIDTDHMPVMNNSLRYGSYNRGSQTALGGESTKTIYRMMGTSRIIEQDCETWIGVPTTVADNNYQTLIGFSYIDQGKSIEITRETAKGLIGQTLAIRGPMVCKAGRDRNTGALGKGKNICAVCAGRDLAENPFGIPAAAAQVGGRFLSIFMSKMHSSTLRTVEWDMDARLT